MSPYCTNCGNEVKELWNVCPNCRRDLKVKKIQKTQSHQVQQYQQVNRSKGNNYGMIALIFGIIGIPGCLFIGVGFILGLVAIIMGSLGIRRDDYNAMAAIGLVLGILDFVLPFLIIFHVLTLLNRF